MSRLSVTIITLNEEKHLDKALESVAKIASEIIVVDSGSIDKTVEIAKIYGAKIFYRKFDNYASQKNFAVEKASGDWILALDGDEIIEEKLAEEIKNAIESDEFAAYSIPRKNIIFGKFIKYTRWQPELDRHVWLFRKDLGKWAGFVHEEVEVKGKIGQLKSAKVHFQYDTVSEFFEMINRYSSIEAREWYEKGQRFSGFGLIYAPAYNFLVRYFYRLGFLDGWRGFVLSYLMAIYNVVVVVKLWELQRK